MNELFADPFGSHVYQAILRTLNGQSMKNLSERHPKNKRKLREEPDATLKTPPSFADLKLKFLNIIKQWDENLLHTLVFDKYAVPLLQIVIESDIQKKPKKKSKEGRDDQSIGDLLLLGRGAQSPGHQNL
jgi:hypothetical protein